MKKIDRNLISELLLIVGSFILAETIVRKYLEITSGVTAWWVLPLLAISIISMAVEIKNKKKNNFLDYYIFIMFILLIFFIGLYKKDIITGILYLWVTGITILLYFIMVLIKYLFKNGTK